MSALSNPSYDPNLPLLKFHKCTNNQYPLKANVAHTFLEGNPNRSYALIMNNSDCQVTIILGGVKNAVAGQGIVLNPRGGNYEINQLNLYVGSLTALASSNCNLSFIECVWD